MRYIFSAIIMLLSVGSRLSAAELGVANDPTTADDFNPDAICEQLSTEFKDSFFLDSNPEAGSFKFKSETGNRIVWVFHPPISAYQADGLEVMKTRFDNLGQGNSVFYLQVDGMPYKLHLSDSASSLIVPKISNERHVALIKAWIATFKGQPISTSMVIRAE